MDKTLATKIIEELENCQRTIDCVEMLSREIQDEKLRQDFVMILGKISHRIHTEAMGKILIMFPELNPYSKENLIKKGAL
jgi:dissimilatory sulfite reductase (desulfoviridin) alpha/beta subunit